MKKLVIGLWLFLGLQLSFANQHETHHEGEMGPCKQDKERLCGTVEKGGGAIRECLMKNKDQLSAECKAKIEKRKEERKEKRKDAKEACKAEVESFCKDIKVGEGRIMKCLKEKSSEAGFGEACKKSLGELPGKFNKK